LVAALLRAVAVAAEVFFAGPDAGAAWAGEAFLAGVLRGVLLPAFVVESSMVAERNSPRARKPYSARLVKLVGNGRVGGHRRTARGCFVGGRNGAGYCPFGISPMVAQSDAEPGP